jgi:hypothetical protein
LLFFNCIAYYWCVGKSTKSSRKQVITT